MCDQELEVEVIEEILWVPSLRPRNSYKYTKSADFKVYVFASCIFREEGK